MNSRHELNGACRDWLSLITLLVLAATAAISPFSLIVFSLVLATDRGARNGVAFIIGWIITVVLIGAVMITVGSSIDVPTRSGSRKWFLAAALALGTILILIWLRRRFRPRPHIAVTPKPPADSPVAAAHRHDGLPRCARPRRGDADVAGDDRRRRRAGQARHPGGRGDGLDGAVRRRHHCRDRRVGSARHPLTGDGRERLDRIRAYVEQHRDSVVNWLVLFGGLFLVYRGLIGLL